MSSSLQFLDQLNKKYLKLHKDYESNFWTFYMGDDSASLKMNKALSKLDDFRSDTDILQATKEIQKTAKEKEKERLQIWIEFFQQYQMPKEAIKIKKEISALETKIGKTRASRTEGYIEPKTKKFVPASILKMRTLMQTHSDEKVRKACYVAREALAHDCLDDYVELVKLRNAFAKMLGYEDFYDYNLQVVDKMTKNELFSLFEDITKETSGYFGKVRELEKTQPGLRKPWNFGYFMSGDFTKEEDPYFQFDQALPRWGRSFSALGIDFQNGKLKLDLLERKEKYNNGFCHWPELVHFENGKRVPGAANFTCNVVAGQVGSGIVGYNTLFHEGGHAAHLLNTEQKEVCLNHEYAPMTACWAETHSMFIDTMFDSIEWKQHYAKNDSGEAYPFELFEKKEKKLNLLRPTYILGLIFVSTFEREVYEEKEPTAKKILQIAKRNHRRFFDMEVDSLMALNTPHIYSWDSSCSYHGYALAKIALTQWRDYFYKKYEFIVDNPKVGKEMKVTWKWGAKYSFKDSVKLATGQKLSSKALIREMMMTPEQVIKRAKLRLKRMEQVKSSNKPIDLKADIKMVHGKEVIANNSSSFEKMAEKYSAWVKQKAI